MSARVARCRSQKLIRRGFDAVVPAVMEVLADADADFIRDLDSIVSSMVYGLLGRFAADEIAITEILPSLDRTVHWLATGYEHSREGQPR